MTYTMRSMARRNSRIFMVCTAIMSAGCGSGPKGFDSPDPADKLDAILAAGERYAGAESLPRTVLENLIQELDSDDAAVRVLAIVALEKITQQRLGYDPYAERQRRQSSIQKWIRQLESGSLHAANGPE